MRKTKNTKYFIAILAAALLAVFAASPGAMADIDGITDQTDFWFEVREDFISTADGGHFSIWGYADTSAELDEGDAITTNHNNGRAQYPGPTIIVTQGQTINIRLTNMLPVSEPVSIVFPGQAGVTATGGVAGLMTNEAEPGGDTGVPEQVVNYEFTALEPGTYMYHSGTNMQRQMEMGLVGALIVRPSDYSEDAPTAYGSTTETHYSKTREFLFFMTEIEPRLHQEVVFAMPGADLDTVFDNSQFFAVYWLLNGRTAPDNMTEAFVPWLPTQPYNIMPRMHPGERLLMRVVNAGRDLHPFHHHGNHATIVAKDGKLLSTTGATPDIAQSVFTIQAVPGQTVDAIFEWTGTGLGWDIYGTPDDGRPHDCTDMDGDGYRDFNPAMPAFNSFEYCEDHYKPIPVVLPEKQDLTFGGWYGGSPFMGALGDLPPGEGGLNPNGGFSYMWHSHTEKELTNWDIFPGGMLTMLIIEPWDAAIH